MGKVERKAIAWERVLKKISMTGSFRPVLRDALRDFTADPESIAKNSFCEPLEKKERVELGLINLKSTAADFPLTRRFPVADIFLEE